MYVVQHYLAHSQLALPVLLPQNRPCAYKYRRGTWWELGPIFREIKVNSIGRVCDVGDPASNQHDSKSSNRYTTASLVINQAQLDWPRQEGFSCKRIEEHKQEDVNTQSDIANMNEENQEEFKNSIPKD